MKKNVSSILVLLVLISFMLGFVGCQQLKVDNLKANYSLQKANGFYTEEKYKKAVEMYEKALELNPDLKSVYIYIGTSYSSMFRPMKTDERNKMYGEKAVEYLVKARDAYPDNEKIVFALGDIYDKMNRYEDCEQIYRSILEKYPDKPNSFYILADFYKKHQKYEDAEAMYVKRIALDPKDPDGYHYFASYFTDKRMWDKAISNHEKRIYSMFHPEIVLMMNEIDQAKIDIKSVEDITKNMTTIKKHKSLDKPEKERLMGEAQEKLDQLRSLEELNTLVEAKTKEVEDLIANKDDKIDAMDDEGKNKVALAYYTLACVCWNKSYQTPPHMMSPEEREKTIAKGMDACQATLRIIPDHNMTFSYISLLWRERIKVDPLKTQEYMAKWKEAYDKAKDLRDKKLKRERLKEQLEKMGTKD
ncbi:MAG: tetratricopeptide repeat protein [bacterium]|nr:tetratricopeptide repeat protein [bacterium]